MRKSIRRKISESIQAKTFLTMLALLVGCCIVIYGMVMIFMPKIIGRSWRTRLYQIFTGWWAGWRKTDGRKALPV